MSRSGEEQPGIELASLGRDLTRLAELDRLPPLHPRTGMLERLMSLISQGCQILLVGPPGCGKTALVESLAQAIVSRTTTVPSSLVGRTVVECSATMFQLGCSYVNQFETRVHQIVHQCAQHRAVLFIDRIEEAAVAGACEGKEERTLANLLIPHLSDPRLVVIGATTPEGRRAILRQNPAFMERFQVLEVIPMSVEEALALAGNLTERIRRKFGVTLAPAVLAEALALGERFYPWRALPGKVIDLLREAAAVASGPTEASGAPDGVQIEMSGDRNVGRRVSAAEVRAVVRHRCGLPEWIVDPDRPARRNDLIALMEQEVFGQRRAVEAVADALLAFKTDLNDRRRPIASFLLLGPTGVGKTQLAKTTARVVFGSEDRLLRYDMAEYVTWDALQYLTGGRRASHRGLVPELLAQPFTVILLDEIEKAHPHVQALLLPLLGEGRLTDDGGRAASFVNTIVMITSNVGGDLYGRTAIGFDTQAAAPHVTERELMDRAERAFLPEFLNRMTRILALPPLTQAVAMRIARRELDLVMGRSGLRRTGTCIAVDEGALQLVVRRGFSSKYGARHLQRAVDELVVQPLAEKLSEGGLPKGRRLIVSAERDRIVLTLDGGPRPAAVKGRRLGGGFRG